MLNIQIGDNNVNTVIFGGQTAHTTATVDQERPSLLETALTTVFRELPEAQQIELVKAAQNMLAVC